MLLARPLQKPFSVRVNTAIPNQAYLTLYLIVSQPLPTMTMDVHQDDKIPGVMQGYQQAERICTRVLLIQKKRRKFCSSTMIFTRYILIPVHLISGLVFHVRICQYIRVCSDRKCQRETNRNNILVIYEYTRII